MLEKDYFFLGIGGIGMSALARYQLGLGAKVSGFDRRQSPLTSALAAEGADIIYSDQAASLPSGLAPDTTEVIYTPAIKEDHPLFLHFKENGFPLKKRAELLEEITRKMEVLAVAGTHGKTTVSVLLAHLLRTASFPHHAFLGGISTNYQNNYWGSAEAKVAVVEADEFDRSFLKLQPQVALLTSMDPDHLDIYGEAGHLEQSFRDFLARSQKLKVLNEKLSLPADYHYGFGEDCQFRASNLVITEHQYQFDLHFPEFEIKAVRFALPGKHNVENALAASALAALMGLTGDQIKEGLESFKGVKRRFEYHIKNRDLVYIDDYAHHPNEISAVYEALRALYPQQEITVIFQPHLFSRTRDFMTEFAESLSHFDHVILMDIYPARERPIPGISSQALLQKLKHDRAALLSRQEIITELQRQRPEILITLGAGDIDQFVPELKMSLLK